METVLVVLGVVIVLAVIVRLWYAGGEAKPLNLKHPFPDCETNGAETFEGTKYYYSTNKVTGERYACWHEDGEVGSCDVVAFAPKGTNLLKLRKTIRGNGDVWKQL